MPYYHVRLFYYVEHEPPKIRQRDQVNLKRTYMVKEIVEPHLKGASFRFGDEVFKSSDVADIQIRETSSEVSRLFYNFESGTNVTDTFIGKLRKEEKPTPKRVVVGSKNVFIVHGRDHKPMKELKEMLYDFGLNPIILHEKESEGSLTLAEKLEEYSEEVGYAFAILTPDDVGCEETELEQLKSRLKAQVQNKPKLIAAEQFEEIFGIFSPRARQNVIFEMGYFWGLLKRKRVCCFLKGDVEKPSDIKGVVYIPFKDSIRDVEVKIIKKLTKAGYEIKLK